jgi:hypothetical protein
LTKKAQKLSAGSPQDKLRTPHFHHFLMSEKIFIELSIFFLRKNRKKARKIGSQKKENRITFLIL